MKCSTNNANDAPAITDHHDVLSVPDSICDSQSKAYRKVSLSPQSIGGKIAVPGSCDENRPIPAKKPSLQRSIVEQPKNMNKQVANEEKSCVPSKSNETSIEEMDEMKAFPIEKAKPHKRRELYIKTRSRGMCNSNSTEFLNMPKPSGHRNLRLRHNEKDGDHALTKQDGVKEHSIVAQSMKNFSIELAHGFSKNDATCVVACRDGGNIERKSCPAARKRSFPGSVSATRGLKLGKAENSPPANCNKTEDSSQICFGKNAMPSSKSSMLASHEVSERKRPKLKSVTEEGSNEVLKHRIGQTRCRSSHTPASLCNPYHNHNDFRCPICGMKFASYAFSRPSEDIRITQHVLHCSKKSLITSPEQPAQNLVSDKQNLVQSTATVDHASDDVSNAENRQIANISRPRLSRSTCSYQCPICYKTLNKTTMSLSEINRHILKCSEHQVPHIKEDGTKSEKHSSSEYVSNLKKAAVHQVGAHVNTADESFTQENMFSSSNAVKTKACISKEQDDDVINLPVKKESRVIHKKKMQGWHRHCVFHKDEQRRRSEGLQYLKRGPAQKAVALMLLQDDVQYNTIALFKGDTSSN